MEGMHAADKILKDYGNVGVLIGGLAEGVWNQRCRHDDLAGHKDTDVMVADDVFDIKEPFYGGIDWWIPHSGKTDVYQGNTKIENMQLAWWENANEVVLKFGLRYRGGLDPGLYIADRDWVIGMRDNEIRSSIDPRVQMEETAFDKFRERVERRVGKRLPRFVREEFAGQILSADYGAENEGAICLSTVDFNTITAINRLKGATTPEVRN
jgi:hypothetical protein